MMKSWTAGVRMSVLTAAVVVGGVLARGLVTIPASADDRRSSSSVTNAGILEDSSEPPSSSFNGVAVLDVTALLNEMPELRETRVAIQADAQRVQTQLQKRQQELLQRRQELQEKASDDPSLREEMRKLAEELQQFQAEVQLQQRELVTREGKALMEASSRLNDVVANYCKENGIRLVLRQVGRPAAVANPQDLLGYVNREVVWAESGIDITPAIKEILAASDAQP